MSSNSTFRILVSTDNHTGYAEDKPVIGNDSFDAFEEVLQHARDQDVDFILLGKFAFAFHISTFTLFLLDRFKS